MNDTKPAVLFGLAVDSMQLDEVVERCRDAVVTRQRVVVGVVNAAKVVKLRHDDLLRRSLLECDLLLADGQSVVWASRVLGAPLPERVAGIDLFQRLLGVAAQDRRSVYLLGASPDVLKLLQAKVLESYPGLTIAGARNGYFCEADSAAVAAEIRASGADMLFLGMTSPKKEIFLGRWGDSLGVPVQHGVGGSFDVLAGVTKRAPVAWQKAGCEWLYRLAQEPRRLWRRYLTTNTVFLALLVKEMVSPTRAYRSPGSADPAPALSHVVIDLRGVRPEPSGMTAAIQTNLTIPESA